MSREALRTQLDALKTDMNVLEAENRRLKEDRPEQATALETKRELAQSREENDRLMQEIGQLKALYEQLLRGTQEAEAETLPMSEHCSALENEVSELKTNLEKERGRHADQSELVSSLREERAGANKHAEALDERCEQLEHEAQRRQRDAELELYRAVAEENRKWEARENRLVRRLEELEKQLKGEFAPVRHTEETEASEPQSGDTPVNSGSGSVDRTQTADQLSPRVQLSSHVVMQPRDMPQVRFRLPEDETSPRTASTENVSLQASGSEVEQASSASGMPLSGVATEMNPMSMAMLAQQLPPLPKFTGDGQVGSEEERFDEWLERLEMVATMCGWNEQAKLVNLITRLRGQAYSFYRSCPHQQRSNYRSLAAALSKRFTPVFLQSVQSSRFHERKQQAAESVDTYAQELKKLFYRAYPTAQQGSTEAEAMGRSVLTCQFVTGLRTEIKAKVAGMDGGFEQLVTKARFEEAKLRDLAYQPTVVRTAPKRPFGPAAMASPHREVGSKPAGEGAGVHQYAKPTGTAARCFNCGVAGHLARHCRQRGRGGTEARGGYQTHGKDQVARIETITEAGKEASPQQDRVGELRRQLREAEVEEALSVVTATMHGITSPEGQEGVSLGPTVMAEVEFEGTRVRALLDTGSPVTIVSMDLALRALARKRPEGQCPEEWKESVKARLESPTITLRNYGGGELNIVIQMKAQLSRGSRSSLMVVQVQKGAPIDLLIGTDVQTQLGFLFLDSCPDGPAVDLLNGKVWSVSELQTPSVIPQLEKLTPPTETPQGISSECPVVRLINATRLPARHSKLVRAHVTGLREQSHTLFEPAKETLEQQGVLMEVGVTEPDGGGFITLAIQNHSFGPVCLKKGQILGQMQQATLLGDDPLVKAVQNQVKVISHTLQEPIHLEPEGGPGPTIPKVVEQDLKDLSAEEDTQL